MIIKICPLSSKYIYEISVIMVCVNFWNNYRKKNVIRKDSRFH